VSETPPNFRLTDLPELVGFFSYSREDDDDAAGRLTALRDAIQRELRGQLGRTRRQLRLWQDKEAIIPGRLWEKEIKAAIEEAVFFIPIITPTVVNSSYCRSEFEFFLEQERVFERSDLVFPILYIRVPELEQESRWRDHPVLSVIGQRQWVDWRQLRLLPVEDLAVRRAIEAFSSKIIETLSRPMPPLEGLRRRREAEEEEARRNKAEAERKRQEVEAGLAAAAESRRREAEAEEARLRQEEAARAREAEAQRQAEARRKREQEEEDARRARDAEAARKGQQQEARREEAVGQRQQAGSSKRPIVIAAAISAAIAVAISLTVFFMRDHSKQASPQAAAPAPQTPAPQTPAPADPAAQRLAELTARERQTYDAARGNVAALRAYVNGCTVCAYEAAARGEIARMQTTEQEERSYNAARGNREALKAYVGGCSACTHAAAAREEIARLETADREERGYNAARGNRDALQAYVNGCSICAYASPARAEIARLQPPPIPCGGNTDAQLIRPIELLYRAVNQGDLDLYAQQWADGATSRDVFSGGGDRTKTQKIESKRTQFSKWQFNLTMDRPPEIANRSATQAEISVYYSISITFTPGECKRRSGVLEKYMVTCGDTGRWQIIDNTDEINVSGSASRC
jgi:hypothetical protein